MIKNCSFISTLICYILSTTFHHHVAFLLKGQISDNNIPILPQFLPFGPSIETALFLSGRQLSSGNNVIEC